jgi:hypothetical protein
MQVYREMLRARAECIEPSRSPADQYLWDLSGRCDASSVALRNMTRWLSKISEHTQGVQSEGWSPGVPGCTTPSGGFQSPCTQVTNKHWSNTEFPKIHNDEQNLFVGADLSWIESRKFNDLALGALEAQAKTDPGAAALLDALEARLPALRPTRPSLKDLSPASGAGNLTLTCDGMQLRLDAVRKRIKQFLRPDVSDENKCSRVCQERSGTDRKNAIGNKRGAFVCVNTYLQGSGAIEQLRFGNGSEAWGNLLDLRYMTYKGGGDQNLTVSASYRSY